MDSRVRHEVCLELGNVHIQRAIEAQRRRQGRDALGNETIQVRVRWALDVKVATANVVQRFIICLICHVGVLQKRVDTENSVVRLHHRRRDLRTRPNSERNLGFLSVIDGQTLKEQASETRPRTTSDRIEYHESLKT